MFCGSGQGATPEYLDAAIRLGHTLARQGIGLVYGGTTVGLMGAVADAVLGAGGAVTGVITQNLAQKEIAFTELSDLHIVDSLHERKARMAELSDGFIALPGGLGTLDEFAEVLALAQLDLHHKPCGLLNVRGYYDELMAFLHHVVEERFMDEAHLGMVIVESDPELLLDRFESYESSAADKMAWIQCMGGMS